MYTPDFKIFGDKILWIQSNYLVFNKLKEKTFIFIKHVIFLVDTYTMFSSRIANMLLLGTKRNEEKINVWRNNESYFFLEPCLVLQKYTFLYLKIVLNHFELKIE